MLEGSILTLEKLNSHRYKVGIINDGSGVGSSDLSFALYTEKDGAYIPIPCKYDVLKYFYLDEDGFYTLSTHNLRLPKNHIIDLTALYENLKPGSYRLVKRYERKGEYYYLTADLVYTGY